MIVIPFAEKQNGNKMHYAFIEREKKVYRRIMCGKLGHIGFILGTKECVKVSNKLTLHMYVQMKEQR